MNCARHGASVWTCVLTASAFLSTAFQGVAGGCGSSDNNRHRNYQDDKCWYELWYFWFVVALVFLTIAVLVIFFCKQQVKRSTGRQTRRCTPVLTMPMAPPQYEVPGHEPPPYHIAITTTTLPDPVTAVPQQHPYRPVVTSGHTVHTHPPGYVEQGLDPDDYDNLSMMSVISTGAFSNPPPYSPPRSAYTRAQRFQAL